MPDTERTAAGLQYSWIWKEPVIAFAKDIIGRTMKII